MADTPQQRAIIRQCRSARRVRELFPEGTRVRARVSGWEGVVQRHVPNSNAQGGYLVVRWDRNDVVGRVSPITVERAA